MLEAWISLKRWVDERRRRTGEQIAILEVSESGATAAEYAVLIAVIAAVIVVGASVLGVNVNAELNDFGTELGTL